MFKLEGTIVRRNCEGILGHDSVGKILRLSDARTCFLVEILEGKNGMENYLQDHWAIEWCIEIYDFEEDTPTWEV